MNPLIVGRSVGQILGKREYMQTVNSECSLRSIRHNITILRKKNYGQLFL